MICLGWQGLREVEMTSKVCLTLSQPGPTEWQKGLKGPRKDSPTGASLACQGPPVVAPDRLG